MIEVTEIAGLFLDALPTAKPDWEEHLEYWEGEPAGEYNDIAVFAHHMVIVTSAVKPTRSRLSSSW